ncbi:MAG: hypothetical protein QOI10_3801 [Solirubrobacterales bacterium]|jgi:diadenosine tetraphosphate (Ap4A) HIT family hydrolase|nr:hypothetical protein [Solirubrobacterales bacterium]
MRDSYDSLCGFCREFAGLDGTPFSTRYDGVLASREVWRGAACCRVLPSIGQLSPGHLLVLPEHHITAFGQLRAEDRREAECAIESLRRFMISQFGPVVLFEHGSNATSASGGCGVLHAHLHLVPTRVQIRNRPLPEANWVRVGAQWIDRLADFTDTGQSYVYFRDGLGAARAASVANLPSQLVRRWLATEIGTDAWDWRSAEREPHLIDLVQELRRVQPPLGFHAPEP